MTPDDLDFLPLKVTHIDEGGRRCFDPEDKRRLIEACHKPGASVSGLALKAGVNANQLRKWVKREYGQKADAHAPAFVPVVEVAAPRPATLEALAAPMRAETVRVSQRPPLPSRLTAQLPNGVSLELECMAQDTALLKAMIDTLRAR
ncbi:transposase [Paraburkholderia piptadeniae]|uniref:Transposase n=1 Tax=Paraburkholderia piptadeniae TaxID=1701573 RepID=A0A1N7RRY2_9BURK|nr:transposase [Paraburkholderia piptadeniae]SIT37836.1 transposase [Paraburkholderia piptadeniae]